MAPERGSGSGPAGQEGLPVRLYACVSVRPCACLCVEVPWGAASPAALTWPPAAACPGRGCEGAAGRPAWARPSGLRGPGAVRALPRFRERVWGCCALIHTFFFSLKNTVQRRDCLIFVSLRGASCEA